MPIVEIQGLGNVEFPDTMSQQDIVNAIKSNIMPKIQATQPAVGVGEPTVTPSILQPPQKQPSTIGKTSFDVAKDLGISGVQGLLGLKEAAVGLASIPSLGLLGKSEEAAEKALFGGTSKDAKAALQKLKSEELQAEEAKVSKTFEDEGVMAGLKEAVTSPRVLAGTVVESVPSMIGGAVGARLLYKAGSKALGAEMAGAELPGYLTRKFGDKIAPILAGAAGEGAIGAGSSAEATRQQNESGLLTPQQAAWATLSGALTSVFGVLGGKVAKSLNIGDVDTMLVKGTTKVAQDAVNKAQKSTIRKAFEGALSESTFEELPQSLQEQALQNIAQGRDWKDGLAEAGTMGFLAGGIMGGGAGALSKNAPPPTINDLHDILKEFDEKQRAEKEKTQPPSDTETTTPDTNTPPISVAQPLPPGKSHDEQAALDELDGKPMPISPIFQPPAEITPPTKETDKVTGAIQDLIGEELKQATQDEKGQAILDDLSEKGITPRSVAEQFWNDTFFKLPAQTQQYFKKYLKKLTSMEPGSVLAVDKEGNDLIAKDWMDLGNYHATDLGNNIEHLEGTERGYVALLDEANRRFANATIPSPESTTQEPEQLPPAEKTPPTEEKFKPVLTEQSGTERELPTLDDAIANAGDRTITPINPDKPMYVRMDWDAFVNFLGQVSDKSNTSADGLSGASATVTSSENKALPKTKTKDQVVVKFRPNTLGGVSWGDDPNQFRAHNISRDAIDSFTIHYPKTSRKFPGLYGNNAYTAYMQNFTKGWDGQDRLIFNLRRNKTQSERDQAEKDVVKAYLKHLGDRPKILKHGEKVKSTPGLNSFQQTIEKYKTLGEALNDLIARFENAIKNDDFSSTSNIYSNPRADADFAMEGLNKAQVKSYIDIMKKLVKLDPVTKTHLFVDPRKIGGNGWSMPGFYQPQNNLLAIMANGKIDTFIHESIHAATSHFIAMYPNHPAIKKLEKLLEASRVGDRPIRGKYEIYGNTDLKEFIAEAFSNPKFIQRLMNIGPLFDKTTETSLWGNLKNTFREMLGITSKDRKAFDEVMDLSDELFTGKTLEAYKYDVGQQVETLANKQTESVNFKKWFMGSKVKNEDGTPMVMYHGTTKSFNVFEQSDKANRGLNVEGFYFTPNPKEASDYATTKLDSVNETIEKNQLIEGANVMPVYLSIRNPYNSKGKNYISYSMEKAYEKALTKHMLRTGKADPEYVQSKVEELVDRGRLPFTAMDPKAEQEVIRAGGYDGMREGNHWVAFDSNQIKSATGNNGNFDRRSVNILKNIRMDAQEAQDEQQSREILNYRGQPVDIRKWEIPERGRIATALSKWFQEWADEHVTLTKVQNAIKAMGRSISDMSDMEKKQELKNSKISDQLLRFANEEVNPILREMLENGISLDDIKQYLHARQAVAYNNRMNELNHRVDANGNIIPYALKDRASGMSTQDANDYLDGLSQEDAQILERIADKWYAIRDKTQRILVESGQETQETIDLWNEIFPDYVPLNREQEQQAVPSGLRTGVGVDVRGNFAKRAMGSEKAIINPVDALLYQRERAVARAENNEVGKSVYRLALENPNPDFWMAINPDAIHSREKLIDELSEMGYADPEGIADNLMAEPKERYLRKVRPSDFVIDPTTGLPIPNTKEVVDARISRNARFGDNVLTLKVNGRERYVFFNQKDPDAVTMVRTLKNLDSQTLGTFLRLNRFVNHYFGQLYTVLNPIFGIVNGIRDYPFGMANLSTTPVRGKQLEVSAKIFPAMRGIMGVLRQERAGDGSANSEWQRIYKEATEAGFQTSNRYAILNTGEDKSYIDQTLNQFKDGNSKKAFRYIIGMTYDFASMIENGVRLATYQQMREAGYSPQQSASVAKNLTINFDKKGSRTGALRSLYLFFNASVRGSVRLAETLRGPSGGRIIAGGILLGVMQAMMMAAAGFKDDDPPEYIREHNLIIPTGDGEYTTIPMPYGLNILPNTGRIFTEYALDVDKNGFQKAKAGKKAMAWTKSLFSTFSPFGNQGLSFNALVPSAVEPLIGIGLTNKNSFGQTISRQDSYKRPTPGYLRTKETGTSAGKEFARWMNLMTGGTDFAKGAWSPTGDDIDFLVSSVTGPVVGSVAKTAKYIEAKQTGEEVPAYKVPVLGRFRGELDSKPVITSRFYNNLNAMYEHELTLKNLSKDPIAKREYMQEHPEARAYKFAEQFDAKINDINAMKKKFQMAGRPQEQIDRLDNKKIILMNRFNDQLEKIRNQ